MNKSILALALALSVIPMSALAQDASAPSAPTAAQRQAIHQTVQRFAAQWEQLHQQMRRQILATLTPVHQRAVAATIGQLAIAPNPDPGAAAQRLDEMLSGSERQRILAAHEAFRTQSRQLRDQLRSQLRSEMPADQSDWMGNGPHHGAMAHRFDAGTILLMTLSPHPMMSKMMGTMMGAPIH